MRQAASSAKVRDAMNEAYDRLGARRAHEPADAKSSCARGVISYLHDFVLS